MEHVDGAVAVVTGGASGIGRGLAVDLLERGVSAVVLADIEEVALEQTVDELAARGQGAVVGVPTDVTDAAAMAALADAAWDRFGGVHVVCLNAGVFAGGHAWEVTDADWDWVLGVNLRGVANGLRAFVPRLVEAGAPAHVLVTASVAGVVAAPTSAPYVTSKFAVLGLAESLHHDLAFTGANHMAVSVICPGLVATGIGGCDRNRPSHLSDATDTAASAMALGAIRDLLPDALDAEVGARHALGQALSGRFYCTTHAGDMWERLVGIENADRLAGRPPSFQLYE
jgi:NAD(P)-dependent dehydrogenase (short-subunit alcohol dehydrogenase family)